MKIWDAADQATILEVKLGKGLPVADQHKEYEDVIRKVPPKLYSNLYKINLFMYEMEDVISQAFELGSYEMAGHLYHVLRGLTHERTKAKHAIADHFKEKKEVKRYGNGY